MPWPTLTLSDGSKIPGVAFGSAGHAEDITPDVIDTAIEVGFSHIDTAQSMSMRLNMKGAHRDTEASRCLASLSSSRPPLGRYPRCNPSVHHPILPLVAGLPPWAYVD